MKLSKDEKKRRFKESARLKLAGIIDSSGSAERLSAPAGGYVRWVREGLGQTRKAVAGKMGIMAQTLAGIEDSEAHGAIKLSTLRRAALALNCTVVYALVPVDMFVPRKKIHDVGAVLDEMAQITARARRQDAQAADHSTGPLDTGHRRLDPVVIREWEEDPSPPA